MSAVVAAVLFALWAAATVLASLRWLRVAQREHYVAGRVGSIAVLWVRTDPRGGVLWFVGVAAGLLGLLPGPLRWAAPVAGIVALVWPLGLSVRPTTGKLVWTARMRRLGVAYGVLVLVLAALLHDPWRVQVLALVTPLLVDAALWLLAPVERRLGARHVQAARERLRTIAPRVVAITGSYGKTSTKVYAGHLASGARNTLVSPASFNNLMGLSRTVNERLSPGTDVFIAEMGTYGVGEIDRLTEVFTPEVAAITTIGEAHLERMRTRATVVKAKSEILTRASVAVLNVDVPELAALADEAVGHKTVVRCSATAGTDADVLVVESGREWAVEIRGVPVGSVPAPDAGHATNLAVAVGICLGLGMSAEAVTKRLGPLPAAEHRATIHHTPEGYVVIDDTYNSNPVGAARAIEAARRLCDPDGRIWVVTPGMVELGPAQRERNRDLAAAVLQDPRGRLLAVQRTNRAALLSGAGADARTEEGDSRALVFSSRDAATRALTSRIQPGDVLLYENDLPDHYP